MSLNKIQTSFLAGELAPSILARTDLAKYHSGAATMRNFFVDYRSGASTRMGTKFVIQGFFSALPIRLIPYQAATNVTYVLEFGHFYIRFISNGSSVLELAFAITSATNGPVTSLTIPGNNFLIGDWIFVDNIVGESQLNGQFYAVAGIVGAIVSITTVNVDPVNSTTFGSYISGGTAARVYTIPSPYASADLALLKFVQSATVMTFTHPAYVPYNLTFFAPTLWTMLPVVFGTTISAPTGLSVAATAGGAANYGYVVTSVDINGQESIPSGVAGIATAFNFNTTQGTITISWTGATGAVSYNVYKAEMSLAGPVPVGASFGFIGFSTGSSFVDSGIAPDFSASPPISRVPFASGNDPGVNCYFQQRHVYAATLAQPTTFFMSQPGIAQFNNFNVSNPIQDDDAITGTIVSTEVNAIRSLVPMPGGLLALTSKGAWQISGGGGLASANPITPVNASANPQAYNGASDVPPLVVNNEVLYVQAKGSIVRDLSYNIYANIYTGTDISVLSNHLFTGHGITEWAYAEEPFKIIWAVRDDGALLSLTFVKEQEIYGWARHDTLGLYKSVASVTEGQVDAIYVIAKRLINGHWVQMIERQANRLFPYGAEDAFCVDCGLQSTLVYPAAGITVGASFGSTSVLANAAVFSIGNVGSVLRCGGGIGTVTAFNSSTSLTVNFTQAITSTLPNDPNTTPLPFVSGQWSLTPPVTVFSGFNYLEGQTVAILADGGVSASQVVVNGQITLPQPATKVIVGLGFVAQLQTMYLDTGEPTIQGKRKNINALTVRCANTRGLAAGGRFDTLTPIKEMNPSVLLGQPIPLVTGDERIVMDPLWDVPGQICLEQSNPLPATVLGVIPEISVGDTK